MTLYVYDSSLVRVGLIEDIRSLQWLEQYQDAGEAKLICSATDKNLQLLTDGARLYCTDQTGSAVIRETVIDDDGKDAVLTVRAPLSGSRWADRIVMATEQIANAEAGMLLLTTKNRRGLPGVTAAAQGLSPVLDTQVSWGSVLDAEKTLAAASGLGFRETFDPEAGTDTFEVYEGTDRSTGAAYNGYFGDDAENLDRVSIQRGTAAWKNMAVVGGAGEGSARKIVSVSLGSYAGDSLRELWVDARDITTSYQVAVPDGSDGYTYEQHTYTDAEYKAMLEARGLEKLAEQLPSFSVSAELVENLMRCGIDYKLGDLVPVKHTRYGLSLVARVKQLRTVYESTGKKVTAILDDYQITGGAT